MPPVLRFGGSRQDRKNGMVNLMKMKLQNGIKISLGGTLVEVIGMAFDIMHHINIGIKTPEGLLTPFHALIFLGFAINFIGVLITLMASRLATGQLSR